MSDPPGRQTRPARSNRRQSWYGHGSSTSVEKDGFGRFLDDLVYVFADVSVFAVPFLWSVLLSEDFSYFGLKSTTLFAWTAMVLVGAALRGGWIPPLGSDVRGWVSLSPALALLRLVFYNAVLVAATAGPRSRSSSVCWSGASRCGDTRGSRSCTVGCFPSWSESCQFFDSEKSSLNGQGR